MSGDLALNERLSDVILKIRHDGFSWRLPAHSLLLVNKSPAFRSMLEERPEDEKPATMTIVGMAPETALAVLKYMYNQETPDEVTADLLLASEKYGLNTLTDILEEKLLTDLDVFRACKILEELEQRHSRVDEDCPVKDVCRSLIESHALLVFATDLVLELSKDTLIRLLQSDSLNVPDESYLFWGIWRWGRMHCSRSNRFLSDKVVANFLDELLVLIRMSSIKNRDNIPDVALCRFDRCKCRRCKFASPEDSLTQCSHLRTCNAWQNVLVPKSDGEGTLCLQVSFDRDVMLVGMTFEVGTDEQIEAYSRIFRESDGSEVSRQRIGWSRCVLRRTSPKVEPEPWVEADLVLLEPLFLSRNEIYSIYLKSNFDRYFLPVGAVENRRKKVDAAFTTFHVNDIVAVRELHLVPDVRVSWGYRGPTV